MIPELISNNLSFFGFILFLVVFLLIKRKNLELQGLFPIFYVFMYKTSLGLDKMDKWSKKHPRLFLNLAYLSFIIGVLGMIFVFFFMLWQTSFIVENNLETGGGLVLPLKTDSGIDGAVPVFYIPFWYWLVALFVLVIVHEFAHGVIAERFKIKIKSSGFAFLGILLPILPAAFVEPDNKQLMKKKKWQQIAVFGAGSTSNFIFGILFLLIWIFVAGPFIDSTMQMGSISFSSVENQSSLVAYGITSGELLAVNGHKNKTKILELLSNKSEGQEFNLTIISENITDTYSVNTYQSSQFNQSMLGISGLNFEFENKEGLEFVGQTPLHFERLIFYIWFLNIAIGMVNLLPLWITDGGQIARESLKKFLKEKTALRIYNFISWISLLMIVFTIYPELLLETIKLLNFS